ncbi:AbrB family transcriptional regulator [Noviherbaspirillum massiliense]|uniref:AbrB family transcriptional regulator n=1 Tax=Noviherbaspirillum massiliense TaxID=1465823 RepID=UPI00031D8218|nr:AbrB family transcriptional regulator [Noviherbaspirillum massiliense]
MQFLKRSNLLPVLETLSLGLVAALICVWLNTPLPWMIGPLFFTAAARMAGKNLRSPVKLREAGQWAIGTALGLYFTPQVITVVAHNVGFIAAGVVFAILLGALCAWVLHKLSGVDKTTAFFAMAIGGASEMATQGERHGARVDRVAASHSLRIMMVVAIIPFAFKFSNVHGLDAYVPAARVVHYGGLALLIVLTSICAMIFKRMDVPNAWVIGPLVVTIALTASSITLSALPEWMVHLGQLLIGVSLGTRFTPEFLHTAPRYLISVAICTLLAMLLAAGFGLALAAVSGIHPATAMLATSPGGIAEMSLTAKTLQLGVPIVTAFHVSRLVILVLVIGQVFKLGKGWRSRSKAANL